MLATTMPSAESCQKGAETGPARALPALTVVLVFALALTKVTSFDTWVHLTLGRWMVENGRLPRTNLLSHTMPDRPTLDHQWLFQLGLYGVHQVVGIEGATLVKAAVVAAAFALVLATARRKGADPLVACGVVLVAALAARFRFTLRPQFVAALLFSTYVFLLERWRHGRRRPLLLLLPLHVLWANIHGSVILGCGIALGYAAGETCGALLRRDGGRRGGLLWLWAVALALILLTMVNPSGHRLLGLPFTHAARQYTSGLKELLQDRAGVEWADLGGRHLFFSLLTAFGLATLAVSAVRKDVTEVGLFLGLLAVAIFSERFIGEFALAAAPIVARNLTLVFRLAPERAASTPVRALVAWGLVGLTAFCILGQRAALPPGLGPDSRELPEAEVQFIQADYPDGNLLNEFEQGGYIAWRTRRPVFLDSRGLLAYDPAFVQAYAVSWNPALPFAASRRALDELLERYRITIALVARERLKRLFATDPRWRLAFRTESNAVFVRTPPQ